VDDARRVRAELVFYVRQPQAGPFTDEELVAFLAGPSPALAVLSEDDLQRLAPHLRAPLHRLESWRYFNVAGIRARILIDPHPERELRTAVLVSNQVPAALTRAPTSGSPHRARRCYDPPVMSAADQKPKGGLEDVVATSSSICYIDGDRGVLAYRGYDIHDLATHATFEEVCFLLWHGHLPSRAELGDLQSQFAAARALPEGCCGCMRSLPPTDGMDMLRTLASALSHYDPDATDQTPAATYRKAVRLTAQLGSIVATIGRTEAGGGPMQPDPAMGFAANFLYMLTGQRPDALSTRALDVALVLQADHELNASTFAARVAAATLTDVHSAVVAGIGTLKGPLHGGANADVMRLLLEFGSGATPRACRERHQGKLARKEKIPGFGHRVYRTMDPRALHLRQMSRDLGRRAASPTGSRCRSASRPS
jgi:citrate synthase